MSLLGTWSLYLPSADFLSCGGSRSLRAPCHPASLTQLNPMPPVNGPREGLKSPSPACNPLCRLTLGLTGCPSGVAGWQAAVASLLLSPRDSKRQAQAAVLWGLDWRQVDLLGKRPLFTGEKKNLGCLATSGQARQGREAAAVSGLGSWLS